MTRAEPISHGAHSPVADTASPATGQPVTDHTATPTPHHAITRHRDRCDDHDDPGPGRVADHTSRAVRRHRGGGPTTCPPPGTQQRQQHPDRHRGAPDEDQDRAQRPSSRSWQPSRVGPGVDVG